MWPLDRILTWLFNHSYRWRQNVLAVVLLVVAGLVYLSVR